MGIILVLGQPVRWQRGLQHVANGLARDRMLLERCALWMGGLSCCCAAVPWAPRSAWIGATLAAIGDALVGVGASWRPGSSRARHTASSAAQRFWNICRPVAPTALTVACAMLLAARPRSLVFPDKLALTCPAFSIINNVLLCSVAIPALVRRWSSARLRKSDQGWPALLALTATMATWILIVVKTRVRTDLSVLSTLVLVWQSAPPMPQPGSSRQDEAPLWLTLLRTGSIAATLWLLSVRGWGSLFGLGAG